MKARPTNPAIEPQPQPTTPAPETKNVEAAVTNKMEAVRRALAADPAVTAKSGVVWIRENLGLNVDEKVFASYKSNILAKAKSPTTAPAPTPAKKSSNAPQPVAKSVSEARSAIKPAARGTANLVVTLKGLIDTYGKDEVLAVLEVL